MCGRYVANSEEELLEIRKILHEISIRITPNDFQKGEIYPSAESPFIYLDGEEGVIDKGVFGLSKWDGKRIFNARSETVHSSRFFTRFLGDPCLIPTSGYFEWRGKEKYCFTTNDDIFFMVGLYDRINKEFVILTKAADENISDIHQRMPLIVSPSSALDWLSKSELTHLSLQEVEAQLSE